MSSQHSKEQFDTWHEIAGYLGISIREAQYRAKSEGLPVRRGVGKKPRVWALRSELDAWKLNAGVTNVVQAPNPATYHAPINATPSHSGAESGKPMVRWTRRAILGGAGLGATAIAATFIIGKRQRRVERAVLTGSLLTALDGLGSPIWTHRFAGNLWQPSAADLPWRVQVVDLEGGGSPGVLAVCSRIQEASPRQSVTDELFYFTPDGHVRWTLSCRPKLLDFDGKEFESVWSCSHVIAVPNGKQQMLWVGVDHSWRWPGTVMRVNPNGSASIQFANAGWVDRIYRLTRPTGEFVVLAGENNAFDRSFVAVLGVNDPPSCSPAGGAARCSFANAPSGTPRDYLLFPATEMLAATDAPYGAADGFNQTEGGGFISLVGAASDNSAILLYEFSGETEPRSVMPSGSCPTVHRRLEEQGRLNHTWAACPELQEPLMIRHWRRGRGWQDQEVPWRATTDRG
jgi:hypothetical protein